MAMIKCPECGKEISDKAAACPNCGAPIVQPAKAPEIEMQSAPNLSERYRDNGKKEKKKKGGKLKWVVIAIVVIFVIAAISGGSDNDSKTASSNKNTDSPEKSVKNQELTEEETETGDGKYHVGDTWENKYVLVSFDKCGEYVSDNQFIQPGEGNKYVYATFTFENVGSSDTTVAYWDFDCYADGYACEGTYAADDAAFSQTLSSGRKITGSVYYEVPESAEEIEFEFSPSFWSSEKIVFVYE